MRLSGLLLLFLALGHLVIMHLLNNVDGIDFAFVAGRYRFAGWRLYDLALLLLALIHGFNGLRTILEDTVKKGAWRTCARGLIAVLFAAFGALGSWVILAFKVPTP
jgi:succinate dehydrogenase / fumarate reductase membrane anchor subunit